MQAVCRRVAPVVDERIDGTRAIGPSGRLEILLRAGLRAHAVKCLTVSLKGGCASTPVTCTTQLREDSGKPRIRFRRINYRRGEAKFSTVRTPQASK